MWNGFKVNLKSETYMWGTVCGDGSVDDAFASQLWEPEFESPAAFEYPGGHQGKRGGLPVNLVLNRYR